MSIMAYVCCYITFCFKLSHKWSGETKFGVKIHPPCIRCINPLPGHMDEIITENNSQFIKAEYFLPPVTQECHCLNQVAAKCQGQPCRNQPEVLSPPKPDSRNLVSSR